MSFPYHRPAHIHDKRKPRSVITFCNKAYAEKWLKALRKQNPTHSEILDAIIEEIEFKNGGDIAKSDMFRRRPKVEKCVTDLGFDVIPSRGQMLRHNGNGIRHAKFAPSKSIAVVWERIGNVIYITFDDHTPIRYHRAIWHLRDIKLGKAALPKPARNTGRFLRKLKQFWKHRHQKKLKGFNPKVRYYE
jgi:hypothetical protein